MVSVTLSNDSTLALVVTKKDDSESIIGFYNLESYQLVYEESIGNGEDSYIKVKEISQTNDG